MHNPEMLGLGMRDAYFITLVEISDPSGSTRPREYADGVTPPSLQTACEKNRGAGRACCAASAHACRQCRRLLMLPRYGRPSSRRSSSLYHVHDAASAVQRGSAQSLAEARSADKRGYHAAIEPSRMVPPRRQPSTFGASSFGGAVKSAQGRERNDKGSRPPAMLFHQGLQWHSLNGARCARYRHGSKQAHTPRVKDNQFNHATTGRDMFTLQFFHLVFVLLSFSFFCFPF